MEPRTSSSFAKSVSSIQIRASTQQSRYILINNKNVNFIKRSTSNKIRTAKYTLITFVPIFLFEQFRKWSNVFFLLIALLQQIPNLSPTGRYTTIIPLAFIMSVSAIKEIIEDIKRQRDDRDINNQIVSVIKKGNWTTQKWRNIRVGDIVRVKCDEAFPADLVLLSSSDPGGICYIETSNLDGESNLKIRQSPISTQMLTDPKDLAELNGTVHAEPPSGLIYDFCGVLIQPDKINEPIGPYQLLLRGTKLRNTAWIYGVVVYTGHETKLFLNFTKVPYKQSSVDKITNVLMIIMFVLFILICVICTICNYFYHEALQTHWYLPLEEYRALDILYNITSFVILFHNVIPISLQVTLEVVRFIQAMFINVDLEMYHEETDTPASARTSNLNDELGQVKYIFADKTGTLTKNSLLLKEISVGSNSYSMNALANSNRPIPNDVHELLLCLTICHTAIPERQSDGKIKYNAESTDERALVDGAARLGYVFQERTHDSIVVNVRGTKYVFQILCTLEFTSARKMMSVIAKDRYGKIRLYCKGADDAIIEKASLTGSKNILNLTKRVDKFAEDGLRTLCFAMKDLSKQEYEQWKVLHDAAMNSVYRRSSDLAVVADQIEHDLTIIGASGIEDELQDGVPETIASLREATINIWVLTGDKQQTAINIGYSSKLLDHSMKLIIMNFSSYRDTRRTLTDHMQDLATEIWTGMDLALIIDGKTLSLVLSPRLRDMFIKLCLSCKVVICCRVSPIQKSEVVENVRKCTNAITLAIGDGANDVAMIRRAHVGIGISGSEGNHATAASDYSIAQFRYLKRLLFIHGAWSYLRISKVILYFFYKNLTFNLIQLWFTLNAEYSGINMFERWSIGLYNVIFTASQPVVIGLFDKPCSAKLMMNNPIAYTYSQGGKLYNIPSFMYWLFVSLTQSLMLYYLTIEIVKHDALWSDPTHTNYHIIPGCFAYTYLVVVVNLESGRLSDSWPWLIHFSIWTSVLGWFLYISGYSFLWFVIGKGQKMVNICLMLYTSVPFWCGMIIVPLITLLPDFLVHIGDGANDVAMIRKAHVGIGIPGTEGRQAATASDYTIAQFSYLKRLLFIHGAWSYLRISKVILFFYYKNLVFNFVQLWFTMTDEYSGENMFQEWLIELYNVIFTAAQPVVVGLFDRPCSAEQMLANPIAYTYSQSGKTFCVTRFVYWIFISITQSLLLYYLTVGMMQHDTLWSTPSRINYHLLPGCFAYTYLIVIVSLQSGLISDSWTFLTQLAIWVSIASWFVFITAYSFLWYLIPDDTDMIHVCMMMFTSAYFWLGMFVIPTVSLLPDSIVCIARHTFFCNVLDKLRLTESRRRSIRRGRFFSFLMFLGGEPEFKLHKSLT